jgi:hypothetical protein
MSIFVHIVTDREKVVEFPASVTLDFVKNKMRSIYGVSNGTLSSTADRTVIVMTVTDGAHYYFRDFTKKIELEDIPENLFHVNDNHASIIFRDPAVCKWFVDNVVEPREWHLEHPDDAPPGFSLDVKSYSTKFADKGLKLWDISNDYYSTVRLNIVSVNQNRSIHLSGTADYLVTTKDKSAPESLSHALCVIVRQSGGKPEEECEHQLEAYLFLLMNRYGFRSLMGLLILDDGRCRAYKAIRTSVGGCVFMSNDTFNIFYLADVVEKVLKDLAMI